MSRNGSSLILLPLLGIILALGGFWVALNINSFLSRTPTAETSPAKAEPLSPYVQKDETVSLSRTIFPIVILDAKNGEVAAQATGFLVGEKEPLVATAFHVPGYVRGKKGLSLHTLIGGKTCELKLLWKHKTADIALMRPVCAGGPLPQVTTLHLSQKTPPVGTSVIVSGYQALEKQTEWSGCEHIKNITICPRSVTLAVTMVDESMSRISIGTAVDQLTEYFEARKKKPKLYFDDLFYSKLLVAEFSTGNETDTDFAGLSGSALFEKKDGDVLAVFTSDNHGRFVFVPAREFPSRYITKRH